MNKTPKILIVDDEPFNVDYLEQELAYLKYETISAVNGQDALDQIISQSPDLVLLDIMMPVMDGLTVLQDVKANPDLRDIPIIVISANNDLAMVVKGIQLGAEDYLPKPFEPALLKARIQSSLERKRLHDLQGLYLKSLEHELNIAREIQKEFLPARLPELEGWDVSYYFKAAKEVAGDFYDAFLLPDGSFTFLVADVCGKGIGAALFMTLFRSLIHAASTTDQFSPGQILQSFTPAKRLQHVVSLTNNYVADTHEAACMFATIFIGILDLKSGKLTYINGGNEPALIVDREGKIRAELTKSGPAIGIFPNTQYTAYEFNLADDDLLIAFTDGIPDTLNIHRDTFGRQRLEELFPQCKNPSDLINKIEASLGQFIGDAEQFDDITLLSLKRKK